MTAPQIQTTRSRLLAAAVAVACATTFLLSVPAASAAESYDNCTGFIDTVPATITTQGVWCLRKNLTTAMASGTAITIAENNVTIDCNGFKLGGLAAGTSSQAVGIAADTRQNATVRGCGIRGFLRGIDLSGDGHLVEDNRLDGNLSVGIKVVGDGNIVQRNRVYDTGGTTVEPTGYGIVAQADILDNVVDGVFGNGANSHAFGVVSMGHGALVRGNRIRNLVTTGMGYPRGVYVYGAAVVIEGNQLYGVSPDIGLGIFGFAVGTVCRGNDVHGYAQTLVSCDSAFDNTPAP